jgi:hypothetical protein
MYSIQSTLHPYLVTQKPSKYSIFTNRSPDLLFLQFSPWNFKSSCLFNSNTNLSDFCTKISVVAKLLIFLIRYSIFLLNYVCYYSYSNTRDYQLVVNICELQMFLMAYPHPHDKKMRLLIIPILFLLVLLMYVILFGAIIWSSTSNLPYHLKC